MHSLAICYTQRNEIARYLEVPALDIPWSFAYFSSTSPKETALLSYNSSQVRRGATLYTLYKATLETKYRGDATLAFDVR